MDFLAEYGLFFLKAITVLVSVIIGTAVVVAISARSKMSQPQGSIEVNKLNDTYDDYQETLEESLLDDDALKLLRKEQKKKEKADAKALKKSQKSGDPKPSKKRVFVIKFDGDVRASAVDNLRQEVNAILTIAKPEDEVIIDLESPGGMVHTYGLAASQLSRLRQAELNLTICVDRVAASGGYLMACVGQQILAAPFAIIGSIGVLAQIPNFNRALKKVDVDYEVMTAGEHKAPVTMFGEISNKGREKLQSELEETHELFKQFITSNRPQVDVSSVATGEVWYGQQAIDLNLIDRVITLDDYLLGLRNTTDIFQVIYAEKKSLPEKLG
ncbi:MAG: protease SohB, partial [Sinobacterium sp.]|nr:protease SohB [Sinobacterium sp.]